MNKKAVELSLNFLVVVILSLTMFSLGMYLIKNFFATTEEIKATLDENTEYQIEKLLQQGEKVAVPINKKTINQKKQDIFGLGILNINDQSTFEVNIKFNKAYDKLNNEITSLNPDEWLFYENDQFTLNSNEETRIPILVQVPAATIPGTYIFNVNVLSQGEIYGIRKIYVIVP